MKPIFQVKQISKSFPGVKALTEVSIDFYPGEVHALVGENGAGKSTLIKIMSGVYTPTDGELIYQGEKLSFKAPKEAIDLGILVIHQELSVANHLTVAENIYLGCEPRRKNGMLDRKKMNRDAQAILDEMNVDMQADMLAGHLNAAQQQMIEIAKVISKQARIVIMDEPTSSLSEHEIQSLFIQIKKLIEKNVSVVYITHRMKEITEIGHRVTVLRDGCKVDTMQVKEVTEKEIVSRMVGREIGDYYHKKEHKRGKEMLRVENLSKQGVFSEISFCAYAGEIVGFSGLVGAGRTEVMEAIFGATGYEEGKVYLEGKEVLFRTPKEAIRSKIGLVTEDRRRTGLLLKKKIRENIVLPSLTRHRKKLGFLNKAWEVTSSRQYMEKLKIKAPGIDTVVGTLSGGNQQKVILAKWLVADSKILILDEPTRGIDVNARSEFYTLMNDFVEQGGAIIMISSEMPEILGVSDRIIVMREGRISGELSREEATEQRVIHMASITSEKE
ncbi:sugar ABC transporter ATP-binding protein [Suipraeoptans intestinalis]|uniref:sugar ABC transporter ATP-binding protein n=1 Tax=Suipraeoptans intestinalis TaxID=2606628 RepID=UPI0023F1BFC7|nr:sugar ABC transporter ATP-binding protein [Suipraeoptans intestinalis]MDD7770196.1 sugar ABC transporter ATP-binding protein [Suipraeoptans intestinalis]MDY3122653.1 sugar ABC transporter ATP-binding protein [Suipraeoptans intestinalis]